MNQRQLFTIRVLALLLMSILACTSTEQAQIQTQVAIAGKTAAAEVGDYAVTQAVQLKQTAESRIATESAGVFATLGASQSRDAIIVRAKSWADEKVPYGSFDDNPDNDYHKGYRADCSGFVSFTWQLPKPGPDTTSFGSYSTEISIEELQKGDTLNNKRGQKAGHMVLFVEWLNTEHTQFKSYDLNTYPGYVSEQTFTLVQKGDGWTINELEAWASGPYYAQRLSSNP